MTIRVTRRSSGQLLRGALALAFLFSLPIACDEDGTSPPVPDYDELPDTIPTGTYEVGDLHVPVGTRFTIAGDVVVMSSGSVVIDGDLVLLAGASLGIAAQDSLVVSGTIGPDTTGGGTAAPQSSAPRSPQAGEGAVRLVGSVINIHAQADVEGDPLELATIGAGTIIIQSNIDGRRGKDSSEPGVPGEDGGDIHIGNDVASAAWPGLDVQRPDRIIVQAFITGGYGGNGYRDQTGVREGRDIVGAGSDGGHGGDVFIHARAASIATNSSTDIYGGFGGGGGGCNLEALNGSASGERGGDVTCVTGRGGDGGDAIVTAAEIDNPDGINGGGFGAEGGAVVRAGNGGAGGNGGSVIVRLGAAGSHGVPTNPSGVAGVVMVTSGGNGGDAEDPSVAGGAGGSISLLSLDGSPIRIGVPTVLAGDISNGGAGYSGCDTDPFSPGSPGGPAGTLIVAGAPVEIRGSTFEGGAGSDGAGPGAGGNGGYDDSGNRLGPDGSAGVSCNQTPSATGANPSSLTIGDSPTAIELTGEDFAPGNCTAYMNGESLETECTSATEATVIVPVALQVAGPAEFCMENGPPGGGLGEECAHATIFNRAPVVISLGETVVIAGEATDLVVNANYAVPGTVVLLDGVPQPTTNNSANEAVAHIAGSEISSAGEPQVSLRTSDGVPSANSLPLTVSNPAPSIERLGLNAVLKDSPGFDLGIIGSRFLPSSTVLWNGSALPVVSRSDTHLIVSIGDDKLKSPGIVDIAVVNPGPGGGFAATHFEVIDPVPVLYAPLDPEGAEAGSEGFLLTLTTGNLGGAVIAEFDVYWLGENGTSRLDLHSVAREQVVVFVTADLVALPGDALVWITTTVYTGQLGSVVNASWDSEERPFTITAELPTISSIAVSEDETGSAIIVDGTGYFPDLSIMQVDGEDRTTTFVSSTQLRGEPTASDLEPGPKEITVHTTGVGTSEPSTLFVPYPQPVLTSTDPAEVAAGSDALDMRVFGDYHAIDYTFTVDGVPVDVVGGGDGYRDLHIPAAQLATEHTAVITAEPTGEIADGPPAQIYFEVFGPVTITNPFSSSATVGDAGTELTITTSGYIANAVIRVNGVALETTVGDNVLHGFMGPEHFAQGGELVITVFNGFESLNSSSFLVLYPQPVLTSTDPAEVPAGSDALDMRVFGDYYAIDYTFTVDGVLVDVVGGGDGYRDLHIPAAQLATVHTAVITAEPSGEIADGPPAQIYFEVVAGPDACASVTTIPYGETASGTLNSESCTIDYGGTYWEYLQRYVFIPTAAATWIDLTAAPYGYVQLATGDVFLGIINNSETNPRLAFLPEGEEVSAVVSTGSGQPDETTYELAIGPAASTDIAGCSFNQPIGVPPFDLTGQTIAGTDCSRFVELAGVAPMTASMAPAGTTIRADEIALRWPVGEVVRVTMESSDFDPIVHLRCSGPSCPQVHYPGTAGPGISIVEVTNPGDGGFLWLGAPFGESGAYSATVELNPDPLPGCVATPITFGSAHAGSITTSDCPVADQYFDLLEVSGADLGESTFYERLVITSPSAMAVRIGDDFPFARAVFDVTGTTTVDFLSEDFEHRVFPFAVLSEPTQAIDYSVESQQLTASEWSNSGCATVWIDPDLTLTEELADDDCSRAGGKREERYYVYVKAGQTLRADVASTAFDAYVEFFDSAGTLLGSNDNVGGGTNAGLFYRPTTNMVISVVVSGADTNLGTHTTRIWFP